MNDDRTTFGRWRDQLLLWPLRIAGRRRMRRITLERIGGRSFVVLPEVFSPTIFRSGSVLAKYIADAPHLPAPGTGAKALDLGTGTGIQAIAAASRGFSVTATDINVQAVRCARVNVLINGLEDTVRVLEGDLFSPVESERFDLVIFNPPFFRGKPKNRFDLAWRSDDVIERFSAGLTGALQDDGIALIIWSSHADATRLLGALDRHALRVSIAHVHRTIGEVMTIYEARN